MKAFVFLLTIFFCGSVYAQSLLPLCDERAPTESWTDCSGTALYGGNKYVGEFRGGKFHGRGIYFFAHKAEPLQGIWENDRLVRSELIPDMHKVREGLGDRSVSTEISSLYVKGTLPACNTVIPVDLWTDCSGTALYGGNKYVGEFRGGKFHGRGIYFFAHKAEPLQGIWENDRLVRNFTQEEQGELSTMLSTMTLFSKKLEEKQKKTSKGDWKKILNQAVQEELKNWITPPLDLISEIPPPTYPPALSLKQEAWETNSEFEFRVDKARKKRQEEIRNIEEQYKNSVTSRNRRVEAFNKSLSGRKDQIPEKRRALVLLGIKTLKPRFTISQIALNQETGSLSLAAEVEGLPKQTFVFEDTPQDFRKTLITHPQEIQASTVFEVSDNGQIILRSVKIGLNGEIYSSSSSSARIAPVQVASVKIPEPPALVLEQQSVITVDKNQVEQILYREENEMLKKRLEEQRKQQEQAIAEAEAKANAEIARLKAEADALKAQAPLPVTNVNYAAINSAHALVIGNSAYPGSAKLANPRNDAKAISAKLRSLGFKVTEVIDASRAQMVRSLSKFSEASGKADVTLLFYAGHGVQISGINYMIPVDTNLSDISEATLQAISLNSVVERYLPGKTKLVFLDACRDNPLMNASSRGVTRGLAPINVSEGTLISYATKDGQTAADGTGQKNSPYTAALLEHLGDPQDIGIVLRTVRAKVMQRTDNRQQPWEYGSLTGGALVLSTIKKENP